MACNDWGSDITDEIYTIGEENPSYTGGAFDNDINDDSVTGSWYAYDGGYKETGWTGQDFGLDNSKIIGKYRVCGINYPTTTFNPKNWTFEGSNTGNWSSEEVVLDTQTNQTFTQQEWKDYEISNSNSYRYYRINVTENNGYPGYLVIQEIEMFECQDILTTFTFTNPLPVHLSTVYGTSQTLQLTVTVSGEDPSYTYDATFYNATTSGIIGSTVSGTNSGQPVSINWLTVDGCDYFWYLIASSSGSEDTSSTYEFTKKFKCTGYTEVDSVLTSGIPIRLYKRDTGELVGSGISTGISGTFEIETTYNEYHYAVALYASTVSGVDITETNALIYDHLKPGE